MSLPTSVPGISFTVRGQVWFRRKPNPATTVPSRDIARATAVRDVYQQSSEQVAGLLPDAAIEAEQLVTLKVGHWKATAEYPAIEFKARLGVGLSAADLVRAARFADIRHEAAAAEKIEHDRVKSLSDTVLSDLSIARVWWLRRMLDSGDLDLSWATFDTEVRPIVAETQRHDDPVTRLANILAILADRIKEDDTRLYQLMQVADATLIRMDWSKDVASMLHPQLDNPGCPTEAKVRTTTDRP
ncbi:MAG: hypothetical protein JWN03_4983 [Nocardia sp.]|uniref:hypothetical protein n=1 Tax=Nocardia sp. TaxID=1821 RepID=UPI00261126C8|nr:hypothetical protein [Nocardia sp.]MCU1644708.1 hypothetical protein [Nocardia sp.]